MLDQGRFSRTHTYADGGLYTVTVTVEDDAAGTSMLSTTAVITGVGLDPDGTLEIIGAYDDDNVTVHQIGRGKIRVHANFLPSAKFKDFPAADVDRAGN